MELFIRKPFGAPMPTVDFSQYYYYPALLCGIGEHLGYRELSEDDKRQILPIFELSQRGSAPDLDTAISDIRESILQRPFLLDLCKEPAPPPYVSARPQSPVQDQQRVERERQAQRSYNDTLANLLRPEDGFANWRRLVSDFPNCIPVIQHTDAANQARQILRQASILSENGQSVAIRINSETDAAIFEIISEIISILPSPDRILIIVDCGQGRTNIANRAGFARDALTEILNYIEIAERPLVRAVCMSNSFTQPAHDGIRDDYEILDWRLWREARDVFPFMFGDYGAMYRIRRQNTFVPPEWRATVVYPLDDRWLIYRHPNTNDPNGWRDGSLLITQHGSYRPAPQVWGVNIIEQAARNDLDDISTARFWYAAKVNIHIHRQIRFARSTIENYGGDE